MRRFGLPRAKPMVTPAAPERLSRCCCRTATCIALMCWTGSAPLSVGSTSSDVVALEARKAAERRDAAPGPGGADEGGRVVVLAEHRAGAVPAGERPLPSVDKYDILLGRETS